MLGLTKKTVPEKLKSIEIFNLDAKMKKGLIIFALACQIISGFTEYLGIAPFISDVVRPINSDNADSIGNIIGLSLAIFLEFLVFYLIGFIVWAIKSKYWHLGEDKVDLIYNRCKFGFAVIVLFALVFVSATLSKKNVKYQIEATPMTSINVADKHDQRQDDKEQNAKDQYETDKIALDRSYNENKQIIESGYIAQIEAAESEIAVIERKQERTGKSYRTSIINEQKKISNLKAQQADELKESKKIYDTDLKALKTTRDTYIASSTATIITDKSKAVGQQDKINAAIEKRNVWAAWVLSLIAQFSVIGAVIARTWICMSNATSGIEEKHLPLPEAFSDNVLTELLTLAILYPSRLLHNFVRKGFQKVPELIQLKENHAVVELKTKNAVKETPLQQANYRIIIDDAVHSEAANVGESVTDNAEEPISYIPTRNDLESEAQEEVKPLDKLPITRINRKKDKFKERQKKKIIKYWNKHINLNGTPPTFKRMSEVLNISTKTISKYVRELKETGILSDEIAQA